MCEKKGRLYGFLKKLRAACCYIGKVRKIKNRYKTGIEILSPPPAILVAGGYGFSCFHSSGLVIGVMRSASDRFSQDWFFG